MSMTVLLAALFTVLTPEAPTPWERTAAGELERYLPQVVAGKLTVGGEADVVFHVGDTAFAREKGIDAAKLEDGRWLVKSFGRDVVLFSRILLVEQE